MLTHEEVGKCVWLEKFICIFAVTCFPLFLAHDENDSGITELLSGGGRSGREEG